MRRFNALFITISLLLFSCDTQSDQFTISGQAEGYDDGTAIYVYEVGADNRPAVIDTLTINGGRFEGTYPKTEKLSVNYLNVDGAQANVVYFPENENLKMTLFKDSLAASTVSGGKLNNAYADFTKRIRGYNAQKQAHLERYQQARAEQDNVLVAQIQQANIDLVAEENAYKKQFITENGNSLYAAMLLTEMVSRKEATPEEAKAMIAEFSPKVAGSAVTKNLERSLTQMKKVDIGGEAPNFSAPTPEGEMLALNDVLGTYTIIDFWASWCKPCRRENPNVVRVYEKYHDKGLNIISVSLDRQGQKDRWLQAIEDDNMDWYHVSNLQFWQDPIAQTYNVRAIPATFLLDENGKIIDKNLRGAALEDRIAGLLGGQ
ncbi:TlpA disulfide reductase family protein [Altibacter sp. HG106]|uniref:TlpA disulfide reductase family protein n=1 Tax=Altibacter sp. HG106 TaxID=3023937 RepID=UPI0023504A7D|nr:TlpA disulfide reductase family protein [Altibacter sp. HG106]MDC7995376.1 TlpA disulfide reductase family protein [Altibacter sp. HG106]